MSGSMISYGTFRFNVPRLLYYLWCQMIDSFSCLKVAFQSVAHYKPGCFVKSHTTTALSAQTAATILDGHEFFRKVTFREIKVEAVHGNQLCKQHVLCLFLPSERISKYETSFLDSMPMKIKIDIQLPISMLLH